jgi:putative oxidoreductase
MSSPIALELSAAVLGACVALWFVALPFSSRPNSLARLLQPLRSPLASYVLHPGRLGSFGLLALRLSIGVMMIHHGQEKLADPQQFASTYVASLHLPFPLLFAYLAGFSELLGSWLVIFGLLTPLGALALCGTMTVAAYQHILSAGFNIYVLELVVLYLGGSLAILLLGPGRFSFDAGLVSGSAAEADDLKGSETGAMPVSIRVPADGYPAP